MGDGIGTLNEKSLHAQLKVALAEEGDRFEVPLDGYFIDIVRTDQWGEELIEIQTRNFSALKKKLGVLTESYRLTLVYPVAKTKWLINQGSGFKRKSPKKGRIEDVFGELVYIPHLMGRDKFALEVVLIEEELIRAPHKWRRNRWRTIERRLISVAERHLFETPEQLVSLLPEMDEPFTTADVAKRLKVRRTLAQKMCYCLQAMEGIEAVGREKRGVLYRRN